MAPQPPRLRMLQGDEADLFRRYDTPLRAEVRRFARTTEEVIEDACSHAWTEMCLRQPEREFVFSWLRRAAIREARRLHRAASQHLSTELIPDDQLPSRGDLSTEVHAHEVLDAVSTLSLHQRTLLTLFLGGHSYDEISHLQDISYSSVNKGLVRARRHLRLVHDAD